ncbi:MAG: RNA-binding protein [Candidatus Methanomethylophilus sp.]|jgi:translin|nr:RNA-binding protein [Methanomethylophilus sp.]MBQ2485651.1 RNA-binding protein [Methanomethylophilus sp.]MBQ4368789.1 RNA-binding protein [Methanomethylophilus sp.]MBQ4412061.1 RNA-binding protein [Methanomethylophilus sp.]MBQ5447640.1 RNA-binding protein [Methanomethylophilus sp.]
MQLHELMSEAEQALAAEEEATNLAFNLSRKIIRKTKTAIHGIHAGQRDPELIDSISSDLAGLVEAVAGYPKLVYGADVESAMMEFAETVIYDYALRGEEIPSYRVLEITPAAWVLGLADSIGELRRDMLDRLMKGNLPEATRIFSKMEELCDVLMTLDIKDSVVPVRRKQDIARGIMDRSRTDITTASMMKTA